MASDAYDVVVIGAGIAGSMAGLLCARSGLTTLIVEKQIFPRHKVCGCCINKRALTILEEAGLADCLWALHPTKTSSLAIRYGNKSLDVPMPESIAVSRKSLDQSLLGEAMKAGCEYAEQATATVLPSNRTDGVSEDTYRTVVLKCRFARSAATSMASLVGEASDVTVTARVVLVCDGLGHQSLSLLSEFSSPPQEGSRIGLGTVVPRSVDDNWIPTGAVLMAVARHGYVGVVEIEDRQLNIAAAIDPDHLHHSKSASASLISIFEAAGLPIPVHLSDAVVKGTIPLTRAASKVASHRVLLLGDSTGYIEPFTGEGMAWAVSAARAVVPLVMDAIQDSWSRSLESRWEEEFRTLVSGEQKICRFLSASLRKPWMLRAVFGICRIFPSLTQLLVHRINRVPRALESV